MELRSDPGCCMEQQWSTGKRREEANQSETAEAKSDLMTHPP